jgi:hypothetical protein
MVTASPGAAGSGFAATLVMLVSAWAWADTRRSTKADTTRLATDEDEKAECVFKVTPTLWAFRAKALRAEAPGRLG